MKHSIARLLVFAVAFSAPSICQDSKTFTKAFVKGNIEVSTEAAPRSANDAYTRLRIGVRSSVFETAAFLVVIRYEYQPGVLLDYKVIASRPYFPDPAVFPWLDKTAFATVWIPLEKFRSIVSVTELRPSETTVF